MASKKRGFYKEYESNPNVPIPKSTRKRWSAKSKFENQNVEMIYNVTDPADTDLSAALRVQETVQDSFIPQSSEIPEQAMHLSGNSHSLFSPENASEHIQQQEMYYQEDPALLYEDTYASEDISEDMGLELENDDIETNDAFDSLNGESVEDECCFIFTGSQISLAVSMLLIITFVIRHGLSGEALIDLLHLIELHCAIPNCFRTSVRIFNKFFQNLKYPIECHYYCPHCLVYWGKESQDTCAKCKRNVPLSSRRYFIVVPIVLQLQSILSIPGMYENLRYPCLRTKKEKENIEDVYDGKYYSTHFGTDGFLLGATETQKSSEVHISLQLNTDGVSLFRSSKFSIWPIFLTINELPPNLRYIRKHRIFAGLWFGDQKPIMEVFLQPFAVSLTNLFRAGTPVNFEGKGQKKVRALLFSITADAPARCILMNLMQFNGFFGCPFCLSPGETTPAGKGHCHTYPYDRDNQDSGHGKLRDKKSTLHDAKEAAKHKESVNGVKGHSWLFYIPGFNIIRGMAVDYMHAVLLGVVKMLMTLWFDKSYSKEPWYIGNHINIFDERYTKLNPPNIISRAPRQIKDNLSNWKASEYRTFLLYFSIPCLYGLLPEIYFQHFLLLAEAIFILDSDSISPINIKKAKNLLKHFCLRVGTMYGKRYETFNLHMLLHLSEKVEDLGPLWCQSCFWYEDYNGDLRKVFHGTQKPEMQIILAVCIQQKIPELEYLLGPYPDAQLFYQHMHNRRFMIIQNSQKISMNCHSIGTLKRCQLDENSKAAIESAIGQFDETSMSAFQRMFNGKDILHSLEYKAVTRRNSYTVSYTSSSQESCFGQILLYLKVYQICKNAVICNENCLCRTPVFLALIRPFEIDSSICISKDVFSGATLAHVFPVKKITQEVIAVEVEQIKDLCVFIDCLHCACNFISLFPNRYEKE